MADATNDELIAQVRRLKKELEQAQLYSDTIETAPLCHQCRRALEECVVEAFEEYEREEADHA